jgi:hypothetical protein
LLPGRSPPQDLRAFVRDTETASVGRNVVVSLPGNARFGRPKNHPVSLIVMTSVCDALSQQATQ